MSRKIGNILMALTAMSLLGCTSKPTVKYADTKNDSVKKYIDLALNDTLDLEKRIKYNDKAYAMLNLDKNDTVIRSYLNRICYGYSLFKKSKKLKLTAEQLMSLSLKYDDSLNLGRAYRNLGLYHMYLSNNEKAIEYFFKAKKIFISLDKVDYILKVMGEISITQAYACDFLGSNKTVIDMLSLSKKTNYKKLDFFCYVKIGNNLSFLKNDAESIKYLKMAEKIGASKSKIYTLNNNIAASYINMKKYDSALKQLNLNDEELFSVDPSSYSITLSLNAYIQLNKNNYTNLEKKFNLAESGFVFSNCESGRNYNQVYLSMYYEKIRDTTKAIIHAKKAVVLSKNYKNPTDVLTCLKQLIKVDKKNASVNALEYIRINDSLQIAERSFRDKFARIAYETDEINQEKEKAVHQKWRIAGLFSLLVLIIALFYIINYQRTKQKESNLLSEQQKANEKIYNLMLTQKAKEEEARQIEKKRIALELHDGIMNKLVSTRLNLSVLSQKTDKETIAKCLKYIEDIYNIEQNIRGVAHELNQDAFNEDDSFIKLLEDFLTEQNNHNETRYELELDPDMDWNKVSSELKMHLYRIIQEASHNINKHANATKAVITFTFDKPNICISITDDGQGFDTTLTPKGIGIQNMKVRVKSLHGKFKINSGSNYGTAINIAIPIK